MGRVNFNSTFKMRNGVMLLVLFCAVNVLWIKCGALEVALPCKCTNAHASKSNLTQCLFKYNNRTLRYSCFKDQRIRVNGLCQCEKDAVNVNGGWSAFGEWQQWTKCEPNEAGTYRSRFRFRECNNPEPRNQGLFCEGINYKPQSIPCNLDPNDVDQSVDGHWSPYGEWGNWGKCEMSDSGVTNGKRVRMKFRECDNPEPKGEGLYCAGENYLQEEGMCKSCESIGTWIVSHYTDWGPCTVSCGVGVQKRSISHKCSVPSEPLGAECCTGNAPIYEYENCFRGPCPDELCINITTEVAPHPQDCSMFKHCSGNSSMFQSCPGNKVFNMSTGICQDPEPGNCGASCITGSYAPSPVDKQMYLHCVNGRYTQRYCHFYYYWNQNNRMCQQEDNGTESTAGSTNDMV